MKDNKGAIQSPPTDDLSKLDIRPKVFNMEKIDRLAKIIKEALDKEEEKYGRYRTT